MQQLLIELVAFKSLLGYHYVNYNFNHIEGVVLVQRARHFVEDK